MNEFLRSMARWLGVLVCLGVSVLCCERMMAQAPVSPSGMVDPSTGAPKLTFDVILVKPNDGSSTDESIGMNADGFEAKNVSVHELLGHGLQAPFANELIGEPKWLRSDNWDILAKVSAEDMKAFGKLAFDQRVQMFQEVLEQRFALRTHHETRVLPVYALVVAKGGVKMTQWKPGPNDPPIIEGSSPGEFERRRRS